MTIQQGDTAENFELTAHDGSKIILDSYKDKKNVVAHNVAAIYV